MLVEGNHGIALRCDRCGSQLIIAANRMQASVRRMPTGWLQVENGAHSCPICARAALATFHARR